MRLSQAIESYIAYKRSLGMGFRTEAVSLRAFIKAVGDVDLEAVQPLAVRRFLDGNGPLTAFWFSKYHSLSAFYRYATARGYVQKTPLPRSIPQRPAKFQPYIYTNDDVRKLIDAADSRYRHIWHVTPDTVRTLLLLLYGTGLKIGEALQLNIEDFDRDSGVLTIRETKFFKSRLVPVGPDLRRVLIAYIERRWTPSDQMKGCPLLGTVKYKRVTHRIAEPPVTLATKRAHRPFYGRNRAFDENNRGIHPAGSSRADKKRRFREHSRSCASAYELSWEGSMPDRVFTFVEFLAQFDSWRAGSWKAECPSRVSIHREFATELRPVLGEAVRAAPLATELPRWYKGVEPARSDLSGREPQFHRRLRR